MLIEATEADLAREEQDAAATRDAASWLASLRGNLRVLEEDTEETWNGRRRLVEQLVDEITVDRAEDGRARVRITYKFARPVLEAPGVPNDKTFVTLHDTLALTLVTTAVK
jgi:hypothetical protein